MLMVRLNLLPIQNRFATLGLREKIIKIFSLTKHTANQISVIYYT